jgi:uncharacterized membrane protein (UPF0127 family)
MTRGGRAEFVAADTAGRRLVALVAAGWLAASLFAAGGARAEDGLEPLEITTSTGDHAFEVEIAKDDAARERGLMFRRFMPADRGMLFEFDRDEPVGFWMKNTYIKLDMIFIAPDGAVTRVASNAEPLSEKVIYSGGPCLAVLELNGGVAAEIGLRPGDRVKAAFFKH